jgi:hypothetical protein
MDTNRSLCELGWVLGRQQIFGEIPVAEGVHLRLLLGSFAERPFAAPSVFSASFDLGLGFRHLGFLWGGESWVFVG